jgi:WD40 repeat protein
VKVWDFRNGQELHTFKGHAGGVTSMVVAPNSRLVFTASADRSLKVWDLQMQRCLATFSIDHIPLKLALAPDTRIVVGDNAGNVYAMKWVGLD